MKVKKIIIILLIINIISIGVIYNFIKKEYLNNQKIIVKAMTGTEYENNITLLNQSHKDYANYIEESKTKIASAITDMGVTTSKEATPETMSSNIRNIARDASSINYDNTNSRLTSTNVQGAVDEINGSLGKLGAMKSVYSNNETCIGTWVNGKPLYRKVLPSFFASANTTTTIEHNIDNVEFIYISEMYLKDGEYTIYSNINIKTVTVTKQFAKIELGDWDNNVIFIVHYTKTTDVAN